MIKRKRLSMLITGAVLALVLALGATAVFAQSDGSGEDAVPEEETTVPETQSEQPGFFGRRGIPGRSGLPEGLTDRDELLAQALGIDLETLDAARETARVAAVEQALAEELITEEQAEMLLDGDVGFHRGPGFHGFGGLIDHQALLADALGISVEALQSAEQQAHEAALAEMVDAGYLSEEEAQVMAARQALKEAIDRKGLMAEVLGISETELEEALANREALATLIEDSGMTQDEFGQAMQAAYEAAVEQAVADGVITTEQYEALQNSGLNSFGPGGCGFGGPGRGGFGHGGPGRGGPGRGGFGGNGGPGGSGFSPGAGQPSTTAPTSASL